MLSKEIRFNAATFVATIEKKLGEGREILGYLINAYHWAGREGHIGEIHRYSPGFTMEWLRSRIEATFHVNPSDLERAIVRFGGDGDAKKSDKICKTIESVGYPAICLADRKLTPEQKLSFFDELPESVTPETFKTEVKKREEAGYKKMGPADVSTRLERNIDIDPRLESIMLRRDNAALRKENAALRAEAASLRKDNSILRQRLKKIHGVTIQKLQTV